MKSKSFTLIELLVVIVIIGILAGVIIVSVSSSISKANFAKAQSFSNTVQNELLGDLVSEWTFNSPAVSGKTEDSWGNNDGTLYGANGLPQIQTKENCVYGTCYLFDGVDDYIEVLGSNVSTSPLAITGAITLSAWIKFDTGIVTNKFIAGRGYLAFADGNYGYSLYTSSDDRVRFETYSPTIRDVFYGSIIKSSVWHFITVNWDGTTSTNGKKIYVDGLLDAQKSSTISAIGQPNYNFKIGGLDSSIYYHFDGLIDDVRIYNEALSSSQIKQQYIAGLDSLLAKGSISKEEYNDKIEILAQN